ncbi:MAG: HPr kinase/phosphorylase [Betaproteobacteria bacterium]|nr:HPr kinase/phosphorylase [Betaproteobacteria bacterium]MDE2047405.1 HPr kinase/phosphorylase [Betaproteobacteria bacterium]
MKAAPVTADQLFEAHRGALRWQWIAGAEGADREVAQHAGDDSESGADLVGYLNYIHPQRIQVLGKREIAYFRNLDARKREEQTAKFVPIEPPALVVADGMEPPASLLALCERAGIPMFATDEPAAHVIDLLRAFLTKNLAERCTMHGVLLDILGMGVLITGESGLGKSELGLELISRGHGLVADDAVEFSRIAQSTIEGRCPPLLQNLLEIRGIGLLDIKAIFGETAVRRKMRLKLIVHLIKRTDMDNYERLPLETLTQDILGVSIRKVIIPVGAGRNIAVLAEAAVRNTILQLRGIDTLRDFQRRQVAEMNGTDEA